MLLSIPHSGTKIPVELDGRLCITKHDTFDDSDPFVNIICDLGDKVRRVIKTDIARTFVDLNRSPQELPPKNPDGLIKSMTCYQKPIYIDGKDPSDSLTKTLIETYYLPYHQAIQNALTDLDLRLCLDCHSMASIAPHMSTDGANKKRPVFCLSNSDGETSSDEMICLLASCLSDAFSIERKDVSLNDPFHGGYITKTYGNTPIPWIQVEMNRNLYLSTEWFDHETLKIDTKRLHNLNHMFEEALIQFCNKCFV